MPVLRWTSEGGQGSALRGVEVRKKKHTVDLSGALCSP